jgi:8-oxo-dGTP diphosphatase
MIQSTLWIMIKDNKIFLWEKKRWFAKWVLNWVWGKSEWDETIEECMIREAKEEIWVDIEKKDLEKKALLHFYFENKPEWNMDVFIFNIIQYEWEVVETEEIKPLWFSLDNIPFDRMWASDTIWLTRILRAETDLEYNFYFDKDNWKMINYDLIK